MLNTKDKSLWKTLKSLQRKRILPLPLVLSDQNIIYDLTQKVEAIAKNFHLVYKQAATLTSPHSHNGK